MTATLSPPQKMATETHAKTLVNQHQPSSALGLIIAYPSMRLCLRMILGSQHLTVIAKFLTFLIISKRFLIVSI